MTLGWSGFELGITLNNRKGHIDHNEGAGKADREWTASSPRASRNRWPFDMEAGAYYITNHETGTGLSRRGWRLGCRMSQSARLYCISQGATREEAAVNIKEAIRGYVKPG